jgi:hypothetical protein
MPPLFLPGARVIEGRPPLDNIPNGGIGMETDLRRGDMLFHHLRQFSRCKAEAVDIENPPFQPAFLSCTQGNEPPHRILDIKNRYAVLPFDIDGVRASHRRLSNGQITAGTGGRVPAARTQDGWKSDYTELHAVPAMALFPQSLDQTFAVPYLFLGCGGISSFTTGGRPRP